MTMPPPRLVVFDVDYTLMYPWRYFDAPGYVEVGRRFGFDLDERRWPQAIRDMLDVMDERRGVPADGHDDGLMHAIAAAVLRALGGDDEERVQAAADEQIERWHQIENFSLYDDVVPCLERLERAGVGGALISNTARDLDEAVEHFGLSRFIGAVAASAQVGVMKPDPRIFTHVLRRLRVRPDEAVMVGDSYHDDILGARAVGMSAVLLDRRGHSRAEVVTIHSLDELPAAIGLPATG